MHPDVIASLVVAGLSGAVGLAAVAWAVSRRARLVGWALVLLVVCGASPVAAGLPQVPAELVVPLLALAPLQSVAPVLLLDGWLGGGPSRAALLVGLLALASAVVVALAYATFEDPRCVIACDARGEPLVGTAVEAAARTSTGLLAGAAAVALAAVTTSEGPGPVRAGAMTATLGVLAVAAARWTSWGVGPRLVESAGWLLLPAAGAGAGVLLAALRTRVVRRRLEAAARRLEDLVVSPVPSKQPEVPLPPPDDGPGASLVDEILRDNLRTAAGIAARSLEVRQSQARVVDAADRERRRIERDLHDGTQQRLVAATFCLALAEGRATPDDRAVLRSAVEQLQGVLDGLRAVGQAVFPRLLESDGLVAALRGLAATAPVPVRLVPPPELPAVPRAEAMSAYACVRALAVPDARHVEVEVDVKERADLRLSILSGFTAERARSVVDAVRDRVGAVGGRIDVTAADEGSVVEVVIPCGS
ncbi:hypothetical protein GCM10011376_17950 [Nocardioides flavus (ex Wang et al. 2016)]|uniref:histidine kinase n=1 Tax=Nocardioides flavus (ex Wang et al. 2016) TaxID=2058780 RepID=A0ABQ3HJT8_9ACTN|nr:histidine kinase [Nocardioides flavus (ex Wang et al. 2016)]GHE17185.1 hypothetical protein GCM10011376_17950 [Nocardioides flavus (ex Wang et al. 2016)]